MGLSYDREDYAVSPFFRGFLSAITQEVGVEWKENPWD